MPTLTWSDLRRICIVWVLLFAGWALTEWLVWAR
jgi:hypothetical protein